MISNSAWAREAGASGATVPGRIAEEVSPDFGRAYREALSRVAGGAAPDLGPALLPQMWRSLADRPSAALRSKPVLDARGRAEGILVQFGLRSPADGEAARGTGAPLGSEDRHVFILRLSDVLRRLDAPEEIQFEGTRMLGEVIGADGANFTEFDLEAGRARVLRDYRRDPSAPSLAGKYPLDPHLAAIDALRKGMPLLVEDVKAAPAGTLGEAAEYVRRICSSRFRAQLTVPVMRADRLVSVMTVRVNRPHRWSPEEIATVREAAVRTSEALERARAEAAMRLSGTRHCALFDSIDEGVCLFERLPLRPDGLRDYRYVSMNPAMQKTFGIPDLTGQSIRDNFPDEVEDWYDDYDRVLRTGVAMRFERESAPQGTVLEMFVTRVEDAAGPMLMAVMKDVTARKRAEEALRESEERLALAFRTLPVGLAIIDAGGETLVANDEMRRFVPTGAIPSRDTERPGRWRAWDAEGRVVDPENYPGARALRGEDVSAGMPLLHTDDAGRAIWTDVRAAPLHRADGRVGGALAVVIDIEGLKRSEEQQSFLLRLADVLRPLADPVEIQGEACRMLAEWLDVDRTYYVEVDEGAGVARVDRDHVRNGALTLAGEHALADFGWSVEILRRGDCHVIADTRTSPLVPDADRPASERLGIISCMGGPLIKDGELVGALCVTAPRPRDWTQAQVEMLQEVAERICSAVVRARAEGARRESEARFGALVNATSDVVYRMSPNWREMRQLDGRGFLRDTREPATDWLGEYIDPADQPEVMAAIQAAMDGKGVFQLEHRVRRRDGTVGWTSSRAIPLMNEAGEIVEWFGTASDVTERRQAEEAVRNAELRLRIAEEAAGVGTFDWLIQSNEGRRSPELLNMLGLREGALGGRFEDWIALIHPDDRPEATRSIGIALESGILEGEWRIVRPDGETIWVLVRGIVERDGSNRPQRMTGAQVDITDRVLSEQQVQLHIRHFDSQIEEIRRQLKASEK